MPLGQNTEPDTDFMKLKTPTSSADFEPIWTKKMNWTSTVLDKQGFTAPTVQLTNLATTETAI